MDLFGIAEGTFRKNYVAVTRGPLGEGAQRTVRYERVCHMHSVGQTGGRSSSVCVFGGAEISLRNAAALGTRSGFVPPAGYQPAATVAGPHRLRVT